MLDLLMIERLQNSLRSYVSPSALWRRSLTPLIEKKKEIVLGTALVASVALSTFLLYRKFCALPPESPSPVWELFPPFQPYVNTTLPTFLPPIPISFPAPLLECSLRNYTQRICPSPLIIPPTLPCLSQKLPPFLPFVKQSLSSLIPFFSKLDSHVAATLKSLQQPEVLVTLLAQRALSYLIHNGKEAVIALPEIATEVRSFNQTLCVEWKPVPQAPPLLPKPAQCKVPSPFSFPVLENRATPPSFSPPNPLLQHSLTVLTSLGSLFFSLRASP